MDRDKLRAHIKKLVISGELNGKIIEICDSEEQGEDIRFSIGNKKYSIGYSYITEDDDDWGQAECYEVSWCRYNDIWESVDVSVNSSVKRQVFDPIEINFVNND